MLADAATQDPPDDGRQSQPTGQPNSSRLALRRDTAALTAVDTSRLGPGSVDHFGDLFGNLLNAVLLGAHGDLVGQRWAESHHVVRGEVVPDRQQRLLACDSADNQAIKFVIGPSLAEEGVG